MLDLVLGKDSDLAGVSPGDQRVTRLVEERFELGAELLAHIIELGIATDEPRGLQH